MSQFQEDVAFLKIAIQKRYLSMEDVAFVLKQRSLHSDNFKLFEFLRKDMSITRQQITEIKNANYNSDDGLSIENGKKFSHYVIQRQLGQGGMGVVYLAYDTKLKRSIALKIISNQGNMERFIVEAESMAKLRHPNVVDIYDFGTTPRPYIAMEFIEGKNLAYSRRKDYLAVGQLFSEIAHTLHFLHGQKIIHRDIKPENIMITTDGFKILDFGLVKSAEHSLSITGNVAGTLAYMSPEQAEGKKVSRRSDIYSLGVTLYQMMTGRVPFAGNSFVEFVKQIRTKKPILPCEINANIPKSLEAICLKCINKDPQKRYISAKALRDDLQRFVERRPIKAKVSGRMTYFKNWAYNNKSTVLTLVVFIVGVLFVNGSYLYSKSKILSAERQRQKQIKKNLDLAKRAQQEIQKKLLAKKKVVQQIILEKKKIKDGTVHIEKTLKEIIGEKQKSQQELNNSLAALSIIFRSLVQTSRDVFEDLPNNKIIPALRDILTEVKKMGVMNNVVKTLNFRDIRLFAAIYYSYEDQKEIDAAIQTFNTIIEQSNRVSIAYLMRAILFYKKQNFDKALADLKVISKKMLRNIVEVDTLFAKIYFEQQKYTLAEKSAEKVKRLTKKNNNILYAKTCLLMCKIYFKSSKTQRISPLLSEIKRHTPTPYFYIEIAKVYLKLRKHKKAIVEYNAALAIEPKNIKALLGMAEAYSDADNTQQSIRFLEEAIKSGFHNANKIKENRYFLNLRRTNSYKKLLQKYQTILR
ncbi:protein kinase [Candidatus Uabimicrobium sp. HlEnr_7]|uniref:protein kinase domain-containing protein n=1 Tax=Candidatus Uabimicrobium helgolandensis TaxID=3095367 RepID=UPI003558C3D0